MRRLTTDDPGHVGMTQANKRDGYRDPAELPSEVFYLIARWLTPMQKFRSMEVSRRWADALTADKLLWAQWDFTEFDSIGQSSRAFALAYGCVRSIRFRFRTIGPDEDGRGHSASKLVEMVNESPLLKTLHINDTDGLTTKVIQMMKAQQPAQVPNMRELIIDHTNLPVLHSVFETAPYLPHLTKLSVTEGGHRWVSNSNIPIRWPSPGMLHQLRHLELSRKGNMFLFPTELTELCDAAPNLELLALGTIKPVPGRLFSGTSPSDTDRRELHLPKLQTLKLTFSEPQAWVHLPSNLKCLQITHQSVGKKLECLGILPFLPALEELSYDHDILIDPGGTTKLSMWQSILTQSQCQLKKLSILENFRNSEQEFEQLLAMFNSRRAFRDRFRSNNPGGSWEATTIDSVPSDTRNTDEWENVTNLSMASSTVTALAHNQQLGELRALSLEDSYNQYKLKDLAKVIASSCPNLQEMKWKSNFGDSRKYEWLGFKTRTGRKFKRLLYNGDAHDVGVFDDFVRAYHDEWLDEVFDKHWNKKLVRNQGQRNGNTRPLLGMVRN